MAGAVETRYTITKLNGCNYFVWKHKLEMLLKEKGVWDAVNKDAPNPISEDWELKDEKAHSTIALNVEDDQIQHIRNCKSARESWNVLKEIYEKDSPSNRVHILRTIMRQRLEEDGDAEKHVNNMHELFQKLMALGDDINPEFFMSATLMGSLSESYDGLITALEARSEDELTSGLVRSKIISEYKRRLERKGIQEEVALRVNATIRSNEEISCYFCKAKGHIKKNCTKYQNWLKRRESNYQRANLAESAESVYIGEYLFGTQELNS